MLTAAPLSPGIKEPERVRKLLQGSANLEFWETYNSQEIVPLLAQLNQRYAAGNVEEAPADSVKAEADDARRTRPPRQSPTQATARRPPQQAT